MKRNDSSLSEHYYSVEVLIQTLQIRLKSNKEKSNKEKQVRICIDSGSQHSCILKTTVENLSRGPAGKRVLIYTLFGGIYNS